MISFFHLRTYKIDFDYVHIIFFFLLKLPNSHSNFHIFWQRLWIQIIQLSDLRTLKALKKEKELENLDLNTMNALFNEKDQIPDLNGLRKPITKIQRVKLRINGDKTLPPTSWISEPTQVSRPTGLKIVGTDCGLLVRLNLT